MSAPDQTEKTPAMPQIIRRPIPGSGEFGYRVRHEYRPIPNQERGIILSRIADPNGEYWETVFQISGYGPEVEQRAAAVDAIINAYYANLNERARANPEATK